MLHVVLLVLHSLAYQQQVTAEVNREEVQNQGPSQLPYLEACFTRLKEPAAVTLKDSRMRWQKSSECITMPILTLHKVRLPNFSLLS